MIPEIADVQAARYPTDESPFTRGLNDALYERVSANPFARGSAEWREYNRGVREAARARRRQRDG